MYNVFEKLYDDERISEITDTMRKNGAIGSILTGSGSAVFGIFSNENTAQKACEFIEAPFKCITFPE